VTNTLISCLWLASTYTQSFLDYTVDWLGKHHFLYVLFYIRYDYIFNKKQKHLSTMCLTQISVNWNISLCHTQARHEQHTCNANYLYICPMLLNMDDSFLLMRVLDDSYSMQPTNQTTQTANWGRWFAREHKWTSLCSHSCVHHITVHNNRYLKI
jgi:hypothetical protein